MANTKVPVPYLVSGSSLAATIWNRAGQVWNGSSHVTYAAVDVATYGVNLSEQGASKVYLLTFPSGITAAGRYLCMVYVKAGASLAESDSGPIWVADVDWDGTEITSFESVAADVWAYATRTLTMTAAQIASVLAGSEITVHRGDTTSISITGAGNISARTKLWFAVKLDKHQEDTEAQLFITEADGLVYVNGADPTASQTATITVTNATTGALTIAISAAATAALEELGGHWELQMLTASGITTLLYGTFVLTEDVVKATS
jgi:hypothetical protein